MPLRTLHIPASQDGTIHTTQHRCTPRPRGPTKCKIISFHLQPISDGTGRRGHRGPMDRLPRIYATGHLPPTFEICTTGQKPQIRRIRKIFPFPHATREKIESYALPRLAQSFGKAPKQHALAHHRKARTTELACKGMHSRKHPPTINVFAVVLLNTGAVTTRSSTHNRTRVHTKGHLNASTTV